VVFKAYKRGFIKNNIYTTLLIVQKIYIL